MNSHIILHSPISINSSKFVTAFISGNRHYKYYNTYLIPYHCKNIDYNNKIIIGSFIYPIWNTIERTVLTNSSKFTYSYLKGNNYTIEYNSNSLHNYHILGKNHIHMNTIKIYETILKPNSLLLFPIDKALAEPLIYSGLM
jgi:hypothetical protein